ncbi:alanine/glycine:cation symporter family protein [Aeromonas hydrophila]|uniref:alanine/glycine:cation symporter family protein n=1 Tax=Aeromonas hydrophila TaxID=644 RepID=UPI00111A7879|nr:sodium:alanine symporter family protein [Aeromonas hydrophila]TNJ15456.1 sodium:alanine symporter family protein [Aeromonas hydrophila]
MSSIQSALAAIDSFIWGPPLLILLVGTGIYLTLRLGLLQVVRLPLALRLVFGRDQGQGKQGDVSSFGALCTALSATIGTGNIVGVATAIKLGGPGALFWMWMAALFGMATKYAECLLAFPQVNAISDAMSLSFSVPREVTAVVLTLIVALVTLGGIQSISSVSSKVVPFMAIFYIVACLGVLVNNAAALPEAIALVIGSAFTGHAATGGFVGAGIMLAIQSGVARGVFSNESGLGSAPIAAAAAKTDSCVEQGLVSMTGTFIDTIIICTMTGLTLVVTGVWSGDVSGAAMTSLAFAQGLDAHVGQYLVSIGLLFFAFTTILGWNYYGERCTEYLFGVKAIKPYRLIYLVLVASGAFLHLDLIWLLADIVNGLMAVPNLIGLIGLRHVVIAETRAYFSRDRDTESEPEPQTA